ncbi:hypothetical protein B0T19DRAFT_477800 [Cercophora scortea]|uniref:HNH nuclease domain-containing protein n=1 Tax=Cercophora scortea TaxID=314031 RepID=A0AAE0I933_9PEZI|nr:hypothetical protein B0T19DRAFT_477800 [Cercophora scortea]
MAGPVAVAAEKELGLLSRAEGLVSVRSIRFLHPGYADNDNILLILSALDDGGGVHHETARIACAILADSRWDGYFSLTANGPPLAGETDSPDAVLALPAYYFCVPGTTSYPVVPSLEHFSFPLNLPPSWSAAAAPTAPSASERVPDRDRTCRMTNWSLPVEIAHIIPHAQADWWRSNNMSLYSHCPESSTDTQCPENAILLRKDAHHLWDVHRFAIVPKAGQWVVHVLDNLLSSELSDTYHNLAMLPLRQVAREYLLARFALAILSWKSMFTKQCLRPRALVLLNEDREKEIETLSGPVCRARFATSSRSKSRDGSPQKRSRTAQSNDDHDSGSDSSGFFDELGRKLTSWEAEQWGLDLMERTSVSEEED